MSTSTSAELFYGFTFPRSQRSDEAEFDRDPDVEIGVFGDDGGLTDYVCAKKSHESVELGGYLRLGMLDASVPPWNLALKRFCERHGITWSPPAWHVAPLRL